MMGAQKAAIVGCFQRGKSTFVNALLGQDVAEMGRGLSTTHANHAYAVSKTLCLIDTPGFNANGNDDGTAAEAIDMADIVVCVQESKAIGKTCDGIFENTKRQGKRIVFLLNCCEFAKWSPEENDDIVSTIAAELETKEILPSVIPVAGKPVFPLNVLWARFGLGHSVEPVEEKKIRMYAEDDLELPVDELSADEFRAEMLRRSGFLPVRDFLNNLPLELLKHIVSNPQREIDRIVDRFAAEFKKRWTAA